MTTRSKRRHSAVRPFPDEAAGHPEVEQDRRSVRGGQQPLPAPVWLTEPSALELLHEGLAGPAPNHARVTEPRPPRSFPDDVAVEQATEPLDVGQFGHGPNLPSAPATSTRPEPRASPIR